ncbi:MAG: sigma 54-interacting transcriptional regulator, partial [bacterium]
AFTGAAQRRTGRCEQAHKSTLFLDEICEMDFGLQSKLLRFVQERNFQRVGGKERIFVDTRIISATNRDLAQEVQGGRFRDDLYYRLNVVTIDIPPLCDRRDDIPLLAQSFLETLNHENNREFKYISDEALDVLCRYEWPGNVRELQNIIAQAVAMNTGDTITREMIPPKIIEESKSDGAVVIPAKPPDDTSKEIPAVDALKPPEEKPVQNARYAIENVEKIRRLAEVERIEIEKALRLCLGNVQDACTSLGVSQATLYRKVKEYGLKIADFKT